MIRRRAAIALLALCVSATAMAQEVDFSGMLHSRIGADVRTGDISALTQTIDGTLQGWAGIGAFVVNAHATVDAADRPDLAVREAYVEINLPAADFRIGRQAILWGQAEGAFITDIVSPQDMSSFIVADISRIRIGVPAVTADLYIGPVSVEAVWLPQFVPRVLPEPGSRWYRSGMPDLATATLPETNLANSEVFGKVSYFGGAVGAEVMAGYAWDDLPVASGSALSPALEYSRLTTVGGNLTTTVAGVVVRLEAAGYLDKAYSALTPGAPPMLSIRRHHEVNALAGLDWNMLGLSTSVQYIRRQILNYDEALVADGVANTGTFRVSTNLLSDTMTVSVFGYVGLDPYDALIRPSVEYSLDDGVKLQVGAELFLGDEAGQFGRYGDNSLAYMSVRWFF